MEESDARKRSTRDISGNEVRRKREVKEVANSSATDGESAETRTANADWTTNGNKTQQDKLNMPLYRRIETY